MKRYTGLFERIVRFDNLLLAAKKAARGKRDRTAVADFEFHLERELLALQSEIQDGSYRPGTFVTFEIRDPKPRRISAAPFRDRVLHHAICNVLEPFFDRRLIYDTYACRSGKGNHMAVKRAQQFARRYPYFLKCDVRKFFNSVEHGRLKGLLRRMFKERPLLELLERIIDNGSPGVEQGRGLPIGNLTSQHFANAYLGELDHFLKERRRVKGYIRYMDDILLFGATKPELHLLLVDTRQFLDESLHLQLKDDAVLLAPVNEGVPYLGFRIWPRVIRLDRRSLRRLSRKVKGAEQAYREGMIDMDRLTNKVASVFAHAVNADTLNLRRKMSQEPSRLG